MPGYTGNPMNRTCTQATSNNNQPSTVLKHNTNYRLLIVFIFVISFILLTFTYYYYSMRSKSTNGSAIIKLFVGIRDRVRKSVINRRIKTFFRSQNDDRLNLAENQYIDDDEFYFSYDEPGDRIFIDKNASPYRTLSVAN
jgi:hypothetical protein